MTFTLPATVSHVHDGDTLTAVVTLASLGPALDVQVGYGLDVLGGKLRWANRCRLLAVNAPELKDPDGAGLKALAYIQGLIAVGGEITIVSPRALLDQYGRILGDWQLPDGRSISSLLITAGLAVPMKAKGLADLAGIHPVDADEILRHAMAIPEVLPDLPTD